MFEERIRTKYQTLTKKQKMIAEFMLARGEEAAFLSISDLARTLGTSTANIFRFAKSVGYDGYPELQGDLRKKIREKLSPAKGLERVRVGTKESEIYTKIFDTDSENLQTTRTANSVETINKVTDLIIEAQRVGFAGFRTSQAIAFLLFYLVGRVRRNCEFLDNTFGSLTNQLINYGPGDVVVGISFPRYGEQTLHVLRHCKEKGATIVSITDTPISPVGQVSDIVLTAANKSPGYFNSFTSAVALVNCLVAGISLRSGKSLDVLKAVEEVDNEWGYFLT